MADFKRKIKFRGWSDTIDGWVYGSIDTSRLNEYHDPENLCRLIEEKPHFQVFDPLVYKTSVGQYTGFTDKNGREIYEDDFVYNEKTEWLAKVRWHPIWGMWILTDKGANWEGFRNYSDFDGYCQDLKIIGNVFEKRSHTPCR